MQRPEGFQSSQCGLHGALPERHTRAAIPCRSSVTLRRCCVRHDPGTGRSRSESPPEAGPRCNRTFCRCRTGRIVISESRPRTVLAHYANLKHDGALPCIQILTIYFCLQLHNRGATSSNVSGSCLTLSDKIELRILCTYPGYMYSQDPEFDVEPALPR